MAGFSCKVVIHRWRGGVESGRRKRIPRSTVSVWCGRKRPGEDGEMHTAVPEMSGLPKRSQDRRTSSSVVVVAGGWEIVRGLILFPRDA